MVRFRRFILIYLLCVVCLTGLLSKLHDLVAAPFSKAVWNTALEKGAVTSDITMLAYQQVATVEEMPSTDHLKTDIDNDEVLRVEKSKNYIHHKRTSLTRLSKPVQVNKFAIHERTSLIKQPARSVGFERGTERYRTTQFVKVGEVYVYGAFLDLRQPGQFTVRLLTLQHRSNQDSLVCRVYDQGEHHILFANAYKMCENHGKMYGGWIYSCVLPGTTQTLPTEVDILPLSERLNHNRTFTTVRLKTIPAETKSEKHQIGVCVPPLFGNLPLSSVINFIEMCKILGADTVFLYATDSSAEMKKFLQHHSRYNSALSVVEWNLPENLTASQDSIWYHGQLLAIQDCLYNNMDTYSFLLFMDLDEMLVPRTTDNWQDMLDTILATEQQDLVAAMSFRSVFFDPTRVPEEAESILYFQHLQRTKAVSKVRNKLIVQPLKVFELGIHHLSKPLSADFKNIDVSEDTALLHHYRPCVQIYEASMKCYPTRKDKTMLKYRDRLTHLSHRVITDASRLFA